MQHNNKGLRQMFGQNWKANWNATVIISSSVAAKQLSPVFPDMMEGEKTQTFQFILQYYCLNIQQHFSCLTDIVQPQPNQ